MSDNALGARPKTGAIGPLLWRSDRDCRYGDAGNRTRVRKKSLASAYERSRRLDLVARTSTGGVSAKPVRGMAVSRRLPAYEPRRHARWHYYTAAAPHQREDAGDAGELMSPDTVAITV